MPKCFVIMPFSKTSDEHTEEYWTAHFDKFLKPLIEGVSGFEANRSEALRQDLLHQIISDLVLSDVVVAELTDRNPNVFWELGVRQSFQHKTITIAEGGTELPFDIFAKGTLFYSSHPRSHTENTGFEKSFKDALFDCVENPSRPDSLVLETISGRGSLFEIIQRDEAIRRLTAVVSELDHNLLVNESAIEFAKKNQKLEEKDKANRTYLTSRFHWSAIELLVTERYLNKDDPFYRLAESYYDTVLRRNQQLELWEGNPEQTESWLLKVETEPKYRAIWLTTVLTDFRKQIETVLEKLKTTV